MSVAKKRSSLIIAAILGGSLLAPASAAAVALRARRSLAGLADRDLAGDVQMTDVPGVLLQQVEQDALQRRRVGPGPALAWLAHLGEVMRLDHAYDGRAPDRMADPHAPRQAGLALAAKAIRRFSADTARAVPQRGRLIPMVSVRIAMVLAVKSP